MDEDITYLVERLEAFEQRVGLDFDSLYAWICGPDVDDEYKITVNGEVHAMDGVGIEESICISLAIYDGQGRVIGTDTCYILADEFFGFDTFTITTWVREPAMKLRLYPRPL